MTLHVLATPKLTGKVFLPASKSYSIRAFIAASLGGKSEIIHPSDCDDALISKDIAESLGAQIKRMPDNCWSVQANQQKPLPKKLYVKESGTALRLLLPLAARRQEKTMIIGDGTLKGRPNMFLTESIRKMGVDIKGSGENDSVPIYIKGGQLVGGHIKIDGSISSQFVSALLMTLPQLNEDSTLTLTGKLVSSDYITMTLLVLTRCGVKIEQKTRRQFYIKGKQKYKGLRKFTVPSDDGLAAFLIASALLCTSDVVLMGHFNDRFIQADGQIFGILAKMGAQITRTSRSIKIKGPQELRGGRFSLKDCPDLLPILSILALFAKGTTRFIHIGHARIKESDRISDLRKELLKIDADISETEDELIVTPRDVYRKNRLLNPHKDHRLAMAFAVLGLKLGTRVSDMKCVSKSYPGFLKDFKSLGANTLSQKL